MLWPIRSNQYRKLNFKFVEVYCNGYSTGINIRYVSLLIFSTNQIARIRIRGICHPGASGRLSGTCNSRPFCLSCHSESGTCRQGFRSGYVLDPDSVRSVDPDPYSGSGSGSRRWKIKMTHQSWKKLRNFMVWSAGCLFCELKAFSVTWTSFMVA